MIELKYQEYTQYLEKINKGKCILQLPIEGAVVTYILNNKGEVIVYRMETFDYTIDGESPQESKYPMHFDSVECCINYLVNHFYYLERRVLHYEQSFVNKIVQSLKENKIPVPKRFAFDVNLNV